MSNVRDEVTALLEQLTKEERDLLSRILRVEQEKLHQKQPQVREDLIRAVREVYK